MTRDFTALAWTEADYMALVARARKTVSRACGMPVQPVTERRPWIAGWFGSDGQLHAMGVRVYGNGEIQGFATVPCYAAGFESHAEAVRASIALGYNQDEMQIQQHRGQLDFFVNFDE